MNDYPRNRRSKQRIKLAPPKRPLPELTDKEVRVIRAALLNVIDQLRGRYASHAYMAAFNTAAILIEQEMPE